MSRPDGRASLFLSAGLAPDTPLAQPASALQLLRLAEAARIDLLVLGETVTGGALPRFDPVIVASWLAPQAEGVGLVPFVATLANEPYHVARALAALDYLARGHLGWMPGIGGYDRASLHPSFLVPPEAELPKGREFVAATRSLWDGWDADALIIDAASGIYLDPAKVRQPAYRGTYFQVRGPLNAARPLQGHPVLVQSDSDSLWRGLAADVLIVDAGAGAAAVEAGPLRSARCAPAQCTSAGIAELERSFRSGSIEGIHLVLGDPQAELSRFAAEVLPELARRGLLGASDRGPTLRARLGLGIPGARS